MKKTLWFILPLLLAVGFVITYNLKPDSVAGTNSQPQIVTQKNVADLEKFLKDNNANEQVSKAYRIAYENPQNVLSVVKCYCGCLKNQGHKNNHDCFFNEDGTFDLMGLNCGLCVKTAILSDQMLKEGKTVEEIAKYFDQKFGGV